MIREKIVLKSKKELEIMRENGRVIAEIFEKVKAVIAPGISTYDIDQIAEEYMLSKNGIPSFKGYEGYPAATCISINEVVIHGIPEKNRLLQEGDIVGIDLGFFRQNLHVDSSFTYQIGRLIL